MKYLAIFSDDSLIFDAEGWEDALDQALGHEACEYGILVELSIDPSQRSAYVAEGEKWVSP